MSSAQKPMEPLKCIYLIIADDTVFPTDYPSACLLGCVNVDDCLDQDEYRKQVTINLFSRLTRIS